MPHKLLALVIALLPAVVLAESPWQIPPAEQARRDQTRTQILQQELKDEQERLNLALNSQRQLLPGQSAQQMQNLVTLHSKNIEALKLEIQKKGLLQSGASKPLARTKTAPRQRAQVETVQTFTTGSVSVRKYFIHRADLLPTQGQPTLAHAQEDMTRQPESGWHQHATFTQGGIQ